MDPLSNIEKLLLTDGHILGCCPFTQQKFKLYPKWSFIIQAVAQASQKTPSKALRNCKQSFSLKKSIGFLRRLPERC